MLAHIMAAEWKSNVGVSNNLFGDSRICISRITNKPVRLYVRKPRLLCTNDMDKEGPELHTGLPLLMVKQEYRQCQVAAGDPGICISRITNKPVRSYVRKQALPKNESSLPQVDHSFVQIFWTM